MADDLLFSWEAIIYPSDGYFAFGKIPIPPEIYEKFYEAKVKRIEVFINGKAMRRGLVSDGQGGGLIILGIGVRKEYNLHLGIPYSLSLKPDPNPDAIDIPEEFEAVLDQDEWVKEEFEKLTIGKQRGLMYYIGSAKTVDTRIKRALHIGEGLKYKTLYMHKAKKEKDG